jgi:hypothetical protein
MLGEFRYETEPSASAVAVRLFETNQGPFAVVDIPGDVAAAWEAAGYPPIDGGMTGLNIALSHGLLLAATCDVDLVITGELSAWPAGWGPLISHEGCGRTGEERTPEWH